MLRLLRPIRVLAMTASLLAVSGCDGEPEAGDDGAAAETGDTGETGEPEPDPTQPWGDRPMLGGACDVAPVATKEYGFGPGDVVPDLVGVDQWGETVSLYEDLCDRTVLIIRAGFDCGECNNTAEPYGELYEELADQGLVVVTVLHESTRPVGAEDQNLWANEYSIEHPVLEDNEFAISGPQWPGNNARPLRRLVGPGAVLIRDGADEDDVRAQFE